MAFTRVKILIKNFLIPSEIAELKTKNFNVILMTLFLSYFPCSNPRYTSIRHAFSILPLEGHLIITEALDNIDDPRMKRFHHKKRQKLTKSWPSAISNFGFTTIDVTTENNLMISVYQKTASSLSITNPQVTTDMLNLPTDQKI